MAEEVVAFIISQDLPFCNFHRVVVRFLLGKSHVTCMKMN